MFGPFAMRSYVPSEICVNPAFETIHMSNEKPSHFSLFQDQTRKEAPDQDEFSEGLDPIQTHGPRPTQCEGFCFSSSMTTITN